MPESVKVELPAFVKLPEPVIRPAMEVAPSDVTVRLLKLLTVEPSAMPPAPALRCTREVGVCAFSVLAFGRVKRMMIVPLAP